MKKALITGANKSIGFETARQLLQKEYYVYLGSRDLKNGQKALARLYPFLIFEKKTQGV